MILVIKYVILKLSVDWLIDEFLYIFQQDMMVVNKLDIKGLYLDSEDMFRKIMIINMILNYCIYILYFLYFFYVFISNFVVYIVIFYCGLG